MSTFFDRYQIQEKKGEGASAVVFSGIDAFTKRKVAMKIAHDVLAKHGKFSSRWQREVILLNMLRHKRIVPLLDAQITQSARLCMVMEFAEQGDLEDKLRKGCTVKEMLTWLTQILEGLAHIHSFGVVHQDIKPENVLINAEGNVWLADFSVARTRPEMISNRQEITGTPAYYSPEQRLKIAAEVGPWTDLYAWGKIVEKVVGSVGYRSGELAKIVDGCLTIDPKQRFQSASEIIPLLEKALDSFPKNLLHRKFFLKAKLRTSFVLDGFSLPDDIVPIWRKGKAGNVTQLVDAQQNHQTKITDSATLIQLEPPSFCYHAVFQEMQKRAQEVIETKESRVMFLLSKSGGQLSEVLRRFRRELYAKGIMDSVFISYKRGLRFDSGYRQEVKELLSPNSEDRPTFTKRVKRWLAKEKQCTQDKVEQEAIALAKWCGFLHSNELMVDDGLGLVYLFQYLQHLSWKGGAALFLNHPELAKDSGDGFDICETLLSEVFGKRPMLVVVNISQEQYDKDVKLREKVDILTRLGAEKIEVARPTKQDIFQHIEQLCLIPTTIQTKILELCEQRVDNTNRLLQYLFVTKQVVWDAEKSRFSIREAFSCSSNDLSETYVKTLFDTIQYKEEAKEILSAMLNDSEPYEELVLKEISESGLQALLQTGIVRQEGRNIFFANPKDRDFIRVWLQNSISVSQVQKKVAVAWTTLSEQWGLRFDLHIGRAWLLAKEYQKAMSPLLLAIRDAQEQKRWHLVDGIAKLIVETAKETKSIVGLMEGRLAHLEVLLAIGDIAKVDKQFANIWEQQNIDQKSQARIAMLQTEICIYKKDWVAANQSLQKAQRLYGNLRDLNGLSQAFIRQGYLLLLLNKLEASVDRFAQAKQLSSKSSLLWSEANARLIELRLRLGWLDGLSEKVEYFWQVTQKNSDVHHMAFSTYAAGLFFLHRGNRKDAVTRFKTSQALAASCGTQELEAQALEYQGWICFLEKDWKQAIKIQRQLIYYYQLRNKRDRRRVAMIRHRVACFCAEPNKNWWNLHIQQLQKSFVHVQFWWWIFQLCNPNNTKDDIVTFWNNAKQVSAPQIWDISLFAVLNKLRKDEHFVDIQASIAQELDQRFSNQSIFEK